MKKVISVMLTLCMVLSLAPAVFGQNPITVFVDDVQVVFDVEPVIENDRTLVPLRAIFEALGAEVSWEAETRTAVAEKENIEIRITIDENTLYKNNEAVALDAPARLISDRTFVPVRAISEGFGAEVAWNGETRQIDISLPANQSENPDDTGVLKETYSPDELSPADMEALKELCGEQNAIRYSFEQNTFPLTLFESSEDVAMAIRDSEPTLQAFTREVWNRNVYSIIMQIQIESDSVYYFEDVTEENLTAGYAKIAKEISMTDEDAFKSIEFTKAGETPLLLVEFKDTNSLLACQYIAVAVTPQNEIRYFTAETSLPGIEYLFFCEVLSDGRANLATMNNERAAFLKLIEKEMESSN